MITLSSDPFSTADSQRFSGEDEDECKREPGYFRTGQPFAPSEDGSLNSLSDEPPFAEPGYGPVYDGAVYGGTQSGSALFAEAPAAPTDMGRAPSLPIVLISAACGIAGGVIALYISYSMLNLGIVLSAGLATLGLLFGLGVSGAALSAATGERGAVTNMAFSCTLIILMVLFMTMCAVAGAAVATLLVRV